MKPFNKVDSSTAFQHHLSVVKNEISTLDNEYVIKASAAELEAYFIDKVRLEPLVLHLDGLYLKNRSGTQMDVSNDFRRVIFPGERAVVQGTAIDIAVPFEGDPSLWDVRASSYSLSGYPEIKIDKSELVFRVCFPDDSANPSQLSSLIDSNIQSLSKAVGRLKNDVDNHNNSSPNIIRQALKRKKELAQSSLGAVAALGIPINRLHTPPTFAIPTKRKPTPIKRPEVSAEKYMPEPVLEEKEYQHILGILRNMSLVIERSPTSFALLDEEQIRDHFLIQLNGHYEGGATGETFNASGKTDILIREASKNVFIAECKFWKGQKAFSDAIKQLLGYLTWRDSKCALMIFNQTKDSSAVRAKMHEVMESLPEHRKTECNNPDGDSRYILVKLSDPGKEIVVTTQLYDVPPKK
ncbi:hypothetical protein [Megalodesulfovibrio paquesii]